MASQTISCTHILHISTRVFRSWFVYSNWRLSCPASTEAHTKYGSHGGKVLVVFSSRQVREDSASTSAVCDVVLVTGTTGRLGSQLLAALATRPDVKTVYALNRAPASDIEERQRKAFESWGLDPEILHSGKIILLTADLAKAILWTGRGCV